MDSVPKGMLIDVRQMASSANPDQTKLKHTVVKWQAQWNAPARKAALSGTSAAELGEHYGVSCKTAQNHLGELGLMYGGPAAGWVER